MLWLILHFENEISDRDLVQGAYILNVINQYQLNRITQVKLLQKEPLEKNVDSPH